MSIGTRRGKQVELFIPTPQLVQGPGHPFFKTLNEVLGEAGFDLFVEELCEPHYKRGGRPGIPPGVYFRMLFIGYFEGLGSQRGIAWRCDRKAVHAISHCMRCASVGCLWRRPPEGRVSKDLSSLR